MTRPAEQVELVATLLRLRELKPEFYTPRLIAERSGVPGRTIRNWKRLGFQRVLGGARARAGACVPNECGWRTRIPEAAYAYLLGMYLGDGCISPGPRNVFHLRITLDARYPAIINECAAAMAAVLPNAVCSIKREGCVELVSNSKHWVCLFPQHGPGKKHEPSIVLEPWQREIALDRYPDQFVRGLIHSDGCRVMNSVVRRVAGEKKRYEYVRFHFTNRSADIKALFIEARTRLNIDARRNNAMSISVARRGSVEILERIVGPKC